MGLQPGNMEDHGPNRRRSSQIQDWPSRLVLLDVPWEVPETGLPLEMTLSVSPSHMQNMTAINHQFARFGSLLGWRPSLVGWRSSLV